ncbi:DEDDh 3'-5' exonuclease domain / DNA polymerase III alpha subunit, partial [hydrothermal vent metagenome]
EYLKETYGVTVYQEQVMLLSQKLAGFTKGEADKLRKAMGKKIFSMLTELKPKFIEGGKANNHPEEILEKIWKDWEAFAAYAFNKSHSTCYAYIAYQTAYLKAHYPSEFMAAVLSNNMSDIKQITFFMEECKRAGIKVLGPDINESYLKFAVNKEGAIRFGMGAIKGVGASAVEAIVKERKKNGPYTSIFDITKRVDLRAANKRAFDGLVMAGALDSFKNVHRAQYYQLDEKGVTFIERAIRFGNKYQENKNSAQISMFGEASEIQFPEPEIPAAEKWGMMEELSKEKEMVGIYISGHPLDDFKNEVKYFSNTSVAVFNEDLTNYVGANFTFSGILSNVQHKTSQNGNKWASFVVVDYKDSHEFRIFKESYLKFRPFLIENEFRQIKVNISPGWINKEGKKSDPRINFLDIQILQDVLEKQSKKITLQLDINKINEESIRKLNKLLKENEGSVPLDFLVYDLTEKMKLNLHSRSTKVKVDNEFLKVLEDEDIRFKLN